MATGTLDTATLLKLQELIEVNFVGRDELYAAADSLDDEDRKRVCRRLAEHLADHAIELQQIVEANGYEPVGPAQISNLAESIFNLVKLSHGVTGIVDAAEKCEQSVKATYDVAIDATEDRQAEGILKRQRGEVEFGEQVLRSMQPPKEESKERE